MKKNYHPEKYIFPLLLVLVTTIIFVLASSSGEASSSQSSIFINAIISILNFWKIELISFQIEFLHIFVRKMIGHFALFGLDGIFGYLTFDVWLNWVKMKKILISILVGLVIASISELIQLFAPNRGPSIMDVLIDLAGFIVGVGFVLLIQKIHQVSSLKRKSS